VCLAVAERFIASAARRQCLDFSWAWEHPHNTPVTPKPMVRNSTTYTWITLWSALCIPIILWDSAYIFFRFVLSRIVRLLRPDPPAAPGPCRVGTSTGSGPATKYTKRLTMYVGPQSPRSVVANGSLLRSTASRHSKRATASLLPNVRIHPSSRSQQSADPFHQPPSTS
jgi:hypothetical protein